MKKTEVLEGGVEVSLGGWCVCGAGEQDGLVAFPQLLDTILQMFVVNMCLHLW